MAEDPLAELVVDCTERIEREGPSALESICREHPEHAAALREALLPLLACGFVGQTRAASEPPARIGEFVIRRELGRGGMGVVYEAVQSSLDRIVALKVLAPQLVADEVSVERFRREGATAALLQHRGIATVHAVGQADGYHYLAMERIVGAPLDRVIGILRSRPVGSLNRAAIDVAVAELSGDGSLVGTTPRAGGYVDAVVAIAEQIASALAVAHARSVIHRDVKPSNVMLRPDGSAVLTDFGLARRRDDPGLTRPGAFAGTPFFTSPEQAAGRDDVDHRTDLFSLGVLIYELLTLQLPFSGTSSAEVLRAIQQREPIDPRRHNRDIPRDVVAILQRLLEKQPARRYASATDLAADLCAFLESRPVTARPITAVGRVMRWARRQPLQATLTFVLGLGVPTITALGVYTWQSRGKVQTAERLQRVAAAQDAILAGYIAVGEGRIVDGEQLLRRALILTPDDVEAWAGLAEASLRTDRGDAARMLAEIEARGALLAGSRSLQLCRARLLEKLGRTDEARREYERLGEPTEPLESFWVGMRLIDTSLGRDQGEGMRAAYRHLLDAVVESPKARPAFLYSLAVAAGELGDEAGARRAARALERFWPDSGLAWNGIGLALHKIDPEAAIAAYRRAQALMPDRLSARNNLANVLGNLGRREESIAELRELVRIKPDYATAHYNLGRALFYEQKLDEALPHLQQAVEHAPEERRHRHYLSWCLLRLGRATESLAAARAAVEALPADALMWRDFARAQLEQADLAAAQVAAERAVQIAPTDPANQDLMAEVQLARDDSEGARRSLLRVVELSTDAVDRLRAREDLARFLIAGKDGGSGPDPAAGLAIAQALAEETLRQDPWILDLLAHALAQNGDLPASLHELDAALVLLQPATEPDALRLRDAVTNSRRYLQQRLAELPPPQTGR